MQVYVTLVLALLVPLATAQWGQIETGVCPEIGAMDSFDIAKFDGRWYDIFHVNWYFGGLYIACVTGDFFEYSHPDEHGLLYQSADSMNLRLLTIQNPIQVNSFFYETGVPGQFNCHFGPNPPAEDATSNFNILETDYDTYACLYSCVQLEENLREVMAHGFSRTRIMNQDARARCESIFTDLEVDIPAMIDTPHDDKCVYYPEP